MPSPSLSLSFLDGGGDVGRLMRAKDWSDSPLGSPRSWPQSLRSVVGLLLNSKFPMFVAWGPRLGFLYNEAYAEILGAKHPRALGRPFQEIWSEIWPDIWPLIRAALAGEATYRENLPLLMNRKGFDEQTWFTFSYSPVRDEDGAIVGMFCACTETTGRVVAERAVRESEARFRNMADHASVMMWVTDRSGSCTYLNQGWYEFTGQTPEVALGYGWLEATHPDDRPEAERLFRLANEARAPFRLEYRLRRADGTYRWAIDAAAPRFGSDGEFLGYVGSVIDIDDRRKAEIALRASEERLRLAAQAAQIGTWDLDLTSGTGHWDGAAIRVGGLVGDAGQFDAVNWLRIVHPDDREWAAAAFAAALEPDGPAYHAEFRGAVPADDGGTRWLTSHATVLRDEATGRPLRAVGIVRDATTRHRHVERLQDGERRLRTITDAVPSFVWFANPAGDLQYFNNRWYEYTGQTPQEAMPTGWAETLHPDDVARTAAQWAAARSAGVPYENECRYRRRDGAYRWHVARAEPLRAEDGEITGWFGTSTDIHDRRIAEERLRNLNHTLEQRISEAVAERKLLADLVESSDAFVQVADRNFRWLAINKAGADEFERVFGVRPQVGQSMLDVLAAWPDLQSEVKAVWSRALAGETFTAIGQFGNPLIERRSYEMKYHPLRNAAGEIIGAYHFNYDVTERLEEQRRLAEAEAARREADALYRTYFENAPEALFVISVGAGGEFVVEQINPAHEAGVGFKAQDVRGKRIEEVLPPEIAERVAATYQRVLDTGEPYQYQEVFDLHGEPQHWDTSLVPMRGENGRIIRLIGSSRNVTRQVMAEEALRQSQKLEAIGQLTGGVAHDFNNLLTPIVASLDMLQRKGLGGDRERRLIDGALQSADRARTLVQRLLAFARRQPLQAVAVDVAKLVRGMGELVASTTGPQIRVVVDVPDGLPPAQADPNQLEMAILNLSVNARDAMPDGGTLRISAHAEQVRSGHPTKLKAGTYIRLSVADTGTGMDEATLARAVEPFFSTKGVGKGTGLGLSMVHGIAAQLGGALTIKSRPGLGTNVELWLPRSTVAPKIEQEPVGTAAVSTTAGRALLVDDEDLVRMSAAEMLQDLGYVVVEAASGEEATRLFERGERFDLLVTDHLMPGITGSDLARAVRLVFPKLPILVVSGYAEGEGLDTELPCLAKPFRKDELAAHIQKLSPVAAK